MDTILELIRAQKDNIIAAIETPTEIEAVVHPVSNQLGSHPEPSGHANVYPWGIPHNFTP